MPMPVCFVCADSERQKDVDARLRAGEKLESIAQLMGCSRWAIMRHKRKHFEPAEDAHLDRNGETSQARLYRKIEKLLAAAEKRRDWKLAEKFVSHLANLQRPKRRNGSAPTKPIEGPSKDSPPGVCWRCGAKVIERRIVVTYDDGPDDGNPLSRNLRH